MTARAIHHTATVDERWDGPAAVAAMPNDEAVLWYCHAWRSADGDVTAKGTYKFPHHKVKGGPANLSACRNGLARLGNADIPESDKAGVRAHLEAHISDAQESEARMNPLDRIRAIKDKISPSEEHDGWYRLVNKTDTSAEVFVYDEIGYWGVTAQSFIDEMMTLGEIKDLTLRINSPGGDVFEALAILNYLRDLDANITVKVDSFAASAASFLAMAGDTVIMMPNSKMMIHEASGMGWGEAGDLRAMADLLDDTSQTIAEIYADRAGGQPSEWRTAMKATTYYSADEAVEVGLADEVAQVVKKKKCGAEARVARLSALGRLASMSARESIPEVKKTTIVHEIADELIPDFSFLKDALIGAKEDLDDIPWDPEMFKGIMADVRDHAPAVHIVKRIKPEPEVEPYVDHIMLDAALRAVKTEGNKR